MSDGSKRGKKRDYSKMAGARWGKPPPLELAASDEPMEDGRFSAFQLSQFFSVKPQFRAEKPCRVRCSGKVAA